MSLSKFRIDSTGLGFHSNGEKAAEYVFKKIDEWAIRNYRELKKNNNLNRTVSEDFHFDVAGYEFELDVEIAFYSSKNDEECHYSIRLEFKDTSRHHIRHASPEVFSTKEIATLGSGSMLPKSLKSKISQMIVKMYNKNVY